MTQGTLANRTIVIAGAGSGMGRATALAAAREGAKLVLVARSAASLDEVVAEITAAGGTATAIAADVTDHAATVAMIEQARERLGRIDALVNTVGTNIKQRTLSELTPESWAGMLAVNLTAAFNLTQAVVPTMREQGDGLIIHVSSSAAKKPDPSGVAYQATKAGVVGLSHGTMEEERKNGIRTSVIFPGLTDTPMVLKRPAPTPPEVLAKALQPEDVAAAVLFVLQLPARAHVPELLLYPSGL
jgi:NADP-dependent 3-hydroxy acid dehydrogenase YdfG